MRSSAQHPALILAALGAMSGTLVTTALGVGLGEAPHLGLYMVLTGLRFGAVVAFGGWRWGNPSWVAALTALICTWVGWEFAVNRAMQLSENWLKGVHPVKAVLRVG